jgi:phospholipase D1/2
MFYGEANRLCKFFEISALGIRLAAEGGYQGKEGYMLIERRSDQIPSAHRAVFCGVHFKNIHQRLTPKWFLARHSYIACVEQPNSVSTADETKELVLTLLAIRVTNFLLIDNYLRCYSR